MSVLMKVIEKLHINEILDFSRGGKFEDKFIKFKGKKKIFFFLMPDYGNIGDQAIALATIKYLEEYFSEYEIIQIELQETFLLMRASLKAYENGDLIILQGGGNLGNLYPEIERCRHFVVKHFKDKKIISFPITISYTQDAKGIARLRHDKRIYSSCADVSFMARERASYDFMKMQYNKNKIILIPDIVIYYSKFINRKVRTRNGILVCIRSDFESNLTEENKEELFVTLDDINENYFLYDTQQAHEIKKDMRDREVISALNLFQRSKLIITDRMHGMIFAAITATPCIVFPSKDHKISGTFEWLKSLGYIKLIDPFDIEIIKIEINNLLGISASDVLTTTTTAFEILRDQILETTRNPKD